MRAVIQRVSQAQVSVAKEIIGEIGAGLCVFLGVGKEDADEDADALADKLKSLRILDDEQGKMNRSVRDIGGALLLVSQFTLYADCGKGNRPSFSRAATAERAEQLYRRVAQRLRGFGLTVATGRFQAHMAVSLTNDGPVTLVLESSQCK